MIKKILKKILQYYLKFIIKIVLTIHDPKIIVIAGSVNKSFAKNAINDILSQNNISSRANPNGFNTEIGMPLAILSLSSGYNSYKNWLPIIYQSFFKIFEKNFPKYLVLELGIAEKGDMKYLLSIINPDIAIITDITKRYMESFKNLSDLLAEYSYLFKKVPQNGMVVINNDNIISKKLINSTIAPVVSYGIDNKSDWQAQKVTQTAKGQSVNIVYQDQIKNFQIFKFGRHHVYALMIGLIIEKHLKQYEFKEEKNL